MANTIEGKILDALCSHLSTLVFSPAIPVAYPNVDFTPSSGDFLEVVFLPNQTNTMNLSGGRYNHVGLFQVSVWSPKGAGAINALDIAGQIVEHFNFNTNLANDGISVKISARAWIAAPLQEGDRIQVPVTIPYMSNAGA